MKFYICIIEFRLLLLSNILIINIALLLLLLLYNLIHINVDEIESVV